MSIRASLLAASPLGVGYVSAGSFSQILAGQGDEGDYPCAGISGPGRRSKKLAEPSSISFKDSYAGDHDGRIRPQAESRCGFRHERRRGLRISISGLSPSTLPTSSIWIETRTHRTRKQHHARSRGRSASVINRAKPRPGTAWMPGRPDERTTSTSTR